MKKNDRIYVAGHRGLAGSGIVRALQTSGYDNLVLKTRDELDLIDPESVRNFFQEEKPDVVIIAAAKVGGIHANHTYPADFIYMNLQIQNNLIHHAKEFRVSKLLFLGSTCIYPKYAPQPLKEEYLLSGKLEPTNEPYAVAKIAGIEMCHSYRRQYGCQFYSAMPTNLYGPNDNFHLENSHVLPGLIHKFHLAKIENKEQMVIWGSGKPYREFLHTDDLGSACVFLLNNYKENEIINIGIGEDISIKDLASLIKEIVGFKGELVFDESKPDGAPRKLVDVTKINAMGWKAKISLRQGLEMTYQWFQENFDRIRQK